MQRIDERPVAHRLQFASNKMKDPASQASQKYGMGQSELSIVALQVSTSDGGSSAPRSETAIATAIGFPDLSPVESSERHGWENVYWDDPGSGNRQSPLQSIAVQQSWSSLVAQANVGSFDPPSPTSTSDNSKPIDQPTLGNRVSVESERYTPVPKTQQGQDTAKPTDPKMEPPRTKCQDQLIPPLTKVHFACYQSHRSFAVSNNVRYPVPCMTCLKSDQQLRWRCTFCCLRICGDCVQAIQKCKARSLKELLESVVQALEGA